MMIFNVHLFIYLMCVPCPVPCLLFKVHFYVFVFHLQLILTSMFYLRPKNYRTWRSFLFLSSSSSFPAQMSSHSLFMPRYAVLCCIMWCYLVFVGFFIILQYIVWSLWFYLNLFCIRFPFFVFTRKIKKIRKILVGFHIYIIQCMMN